MYVNVCLDMDTCTCVTVYVCGRGRVSPFRGKKRLWDRDSDQGPSGPENGSGEEVRITFVKVLLPFLYKKRFVNFRLKFFSYQVN